MIRSPEIEALPRDRMEALQVERLRRTVDHVLERVPPIARRLRAAGVTRGADVRCLADLGRLPFTTRADFQEHYPTGLFAVPPESVVRIHASSGTHGRPKIVGYTRNDLAIWSEVVARCLVMAGVRPGMLVHNAYGYGLFTGGLGLHQGAELLGCRVIPASGGFTQRQAVVLRDLGGEVLCSTPSYALHIAEVVEGAGIPLRDLRLRIGVFGAEPWTEEMRSAIERRLGIVALNIYGLSEIIGPGVSGECLHRRGMHVAEDHFLVECVDPETLEPLPDGEVGELVFTTLTLEAMPLLRYRTRDLASIDRGPCPCGRTGARMSRVKGRSDDMLIVRGVNVFPSQIEEALLRAEGTAPHYLIEVSRPGALDEAVVKVEVRPGDFRDEMRQMVELRDRIDREIHAVTGIRMTVELVAPNTLERSTGKAKRVLDHRKLSG